MNLSKSFSISINTTWTAATRLDLDADQLGHLIVIAAPVSLFLFAFISGRRPASPAIRILPCRSSPWRTGTTKLRSSCKEFVFNNVIQFFEYCLITSVLTSTNSLSHWSTRAGRGTRLGSGRPLLHLLRVFWQRRLLLAIVVKIAIVYVCKSCVSSGRCDRISEIVLIPCVESKLTAASPTCHTGAWRRSSVTRSGRKCILLPSKGESPHGKAVSSTT